MSAFHPKLTLTFEHYPVAVSIRAVFQPRGMMWASIALTAAYVLSMAFVDHLPEPDLRTEVEFLLLGEAGFAGPMIIGSILSVLMREVAARRLIVGFQVGYILITLSTFHSTFAGEHDAQYQLALLFIPVFGYGVILFAALLGAISWLMSRLG